ncbi:Gag [Salix suchowensis]|nr:Gag [Salix suchowensis]
MSNLAKLEFVALDNTRKNYLSWSLDVKMHLDIMGFGDTIIDDNKSYSENKTKTMIFLRHHLHKALKIKYLTIKETLIPWKELKEKYNYQMTIILPKAYYD